MSTKKTKKRKTGSIRTKPKKGDKLKAQIVSDLHLEFPNVLAEVENLVPVVADILILPGDIGNISSPSYIPFFKWASKSFRHVLYVPGNHEFYHQEYFTALEKMKEIFATLPNVHFLYRSGVRIEGVRFLGMTLWTCPPNNKKEYIQAIYNDYRYVGVLDKGRKRPRYLSIHDTCRFHKEDIAWLTREIKKSRDLKEEVYVISHHLPLMGLKFLIPKERTRGVSDVIYGNCTDESEFILQNLDTLKAWFHGHTHYSMITTYSEEDKYGKKLVKKRRDKILKKLIEKKKLEIEEKKKLRELRRRERNAKRLKRKKKKVKKRREQKKKMEEEKKNIDQGEKKTSREEEEEEVEGEGKEEEEVESTISEEIKEEVQQNTDTEVEHDDALFDTSTSEEEEEEEVEPEDVKIDLEEEEEEEEEELDGEVVVQLEEINRLWVISNQVGYASGRELSGYRRNLLVDVPLPKAPEFIRKPIQVKKNTGGKKKVRANKPSSLNGSARWGANIGKLRRTQSNLETSTHRGNQNGIRDKVSGLFLSWRNFIFGDQN